MGRKRNPCDSKRIKSSSHHIHVETPDLPQEIIRDILMRLPVKSILKFKCVSKAWLYLISSSQFVQDHLKRSAENADFATHRIIFTVTTPRFNLKECSASSLMMSRRGTVPSILDHPGRRPHECAWVVGSCRGLVCIALDESNVYLWNPSTRKSKKMPPIGIEERPEFNYLWGFGYCESDDDYKVVGIFYDLHGRGTQESRVKMYSSRGDSWKRIGDFRGGIPLNDPGKLANGKLYYTSSRWDIVSIDLESGGYGIVEHPNYEKGCSSFSLGSCGGRLSLLCEFPWKRAELWVLKEGESWSIAASIPYSNEPGDPLFTTPLLIMPNGDVLLRLGMHLVIYSSKDKCLRRPRITNCGTFLGVNTYYETLVPL